jgi:hypothetical protein
MKPAAAYNLFSIDGSPGAWNLKAERFSLNADGTDVRQESVDIFRA